MGVLKKVWKYLAPMARKHLAPIAKQALAALAEEGLGAGQKVLEEVRKGGDLSEAMATQGSDAADRLMQRAVTTLRTQKGSGATVTKRVAGKRSLSTLDLLGRSVPQSTVKKARRGDTQGLF